MKKLCAVLALAGALAACASGTKLTSQWRDPDSGPLEFKKVLVIVIAPYESQRRSGEIQLVSLMKKVTGIPAHTLISAEDAKDASKLKGLVEKGGFDGAVTMRFIGSNQELTMSAPGVYAPAYYGFYSYYSFAWPMVYDPGYMRTDTYIRIETQVYSVKSDKLVWAGVSSSANPKSASQLVDAVAHAVAAEMRKQKLIG
jgi:hypothetical protein